MKPRYTKVIRDLSSDYAKNLMLVLAIAIGVFGIGSIMASRAVLEREMRTNYMSTNPASATIETDGHIPQAIVDSARRFPGIKAAERRATVLARMKIDDRWLHILLFVIDDFEKMEISKVLPISGARIPADGEMLVERTALTVMNVKAGDSITVRTPHGTPQPLKITGIVHDPGLAPAWQEQAGYGYIALSTLSRLGENAGFDLLRIQVAENPMSTDHITRKSEALADWLKTQGVKIHEIQIPPPGMHPHQGQMTAVLSIFTVFSFMILILGAILVATSMATLMVKQVRQIGVMKTIGGTSAQIASLYIFMMLMLCAAAIALGIPLSRWAAYGFYTQIAVLLNLDITDPSIPLSVPLIQIASGVLIPLLATAVPLARGSRISVRAALDNFGVSAAKQGGFAKFLSRLTLFSDTYRLALRNAGRQRSRLALTLGLLAAGGAMFMTALNVSDAWDINLKKIYTQRLYDQEVRLNDRVAPAAILDKIRAVRGVKAAEGWDYSTTSILSASDYEISRTYPDKGHGSFNMLALPVNSRLLNPTVVEGRWLQTEGTDEVVLNQLARTAGIKIGDRIALSAGGVPSSWKIVGFTEDVGSSATAYVSLATFSKQVNAPGTIRMLRIAYTDRSYDFAVSRNREIDRLLEKQQVVVSSTTPVWLLHNAVAAHMKVLVNSLLAMAMLMAVVGTLGLTSAMSMNVLERTREIGVMRAIGATPRKIRNLIVWEGITIGLLSVVVAFVASLALSYYLGRFIGHISFRTTLTLAISLPAIGIWLAIIFMGSYLATIFPARKANKITTREALAYE